MCYKGAQPPPLSQTGSIVGTRSKVGVSTLLLAQIRDQDMMSPNMAHPVPTHFEAPTASMSKTIVPLVPLVWRLEAWLALSNPVTLAHQDNLTRLCNSVQFRWFAFKGQAYQYKVLHLGLSLSSRVFTKVAEAALAPVGIRIFNFLDYWLTLTVLAH